MARDLETLIEVLRASLAVKRTMQKTSTVAARDKVVTRLYALLDAIEGGK